MKRLIFLSVFIIVLLISTCVYLLLAERIISLTDIFFNIFLNEEEINISGYFVCSMVSICALMFLCSLVLYRLTHPTDEILKYMSGVSMYLNAISLVIVSIILASPTVHVNWKPMVCDYLDDHILYPERVNKTFIKQCFSRP